MNKIGCVILFLLIGSAFTTDKKPLFDIPKQIVDLNKLIEINANPDERTTPPFKISRLVTFREYKEYLSDTKKDSSEAYYLSQFPDTNITPDKEVYQKYIEGKGYENLPVVGISWDNAMNFCRWKTMKEMKDTVATIYRLPLCSEWLIAHNFLKIKNIRHDFNQNYADWLLSSKDDAVYDFTGKNRFPFDMLYFHRLKDPSTLKRKLVIGQSYLYRQKLNEFFSYYADEGYRHIGFRYVVEPVENSFWLNNSILKSWGLLKTTRR